MDDPSQPRTHLSWANVVLGFLFVAFDAGVSQAFGLGIGSGLLTAAVRSIVQLSLLSLVLQKIFDTGNPWGVAGLAILLNLLASVEVVVNKSKMRFNHMFPIVIFSMLASTIPISIVGTQFAMAIEPFWTPDQYIPVVGMICGATIAAVVVAINYVLGEIYENRDKIETYLAFGATRFEACQPVAKEALRLALTPPINQMRTFILWVITFFLIVLGIISIPGMMTGAILGGSSVQQAARLQMVIMFMIAASGSLAAILVTVLALSVVVDAEHRIRTERVDPRKHPVWRARDWLEGQIKSGVESAVGWVKIKFNWKTADGRSEGETEGLLG